MALQMQNTKENIEVLAEIEEETVYQTTVKSEPATDDDQADVEWERRGPLEQEVVAADSEEVMSNTSGIEMLDSTSDEEGSVVNIKLLQLKMEGSVLLKCVKGTLVDDCYACEIDELGQKYHACLSFENDQGDVCSTVSIICNKISITHLMSTILCIAKAKRGVYVTAETEKEIVRRLKAIRADHQPLVTIKNLLENADSEILEMANRVVKKKHYKMFYKRSRRY
ncbi:hypothetical protein EOD39_3256 [Acipenser ruthenus]|uniref:Uncharacterized protein n=1 Tax=Acipenser ruthenus TaxID=7906 RepID=A0A444UP42_ACIRT|nr:hypothetical protein EOD39_3256 [Acipenser ruthenus]